MRLLIVALLSSTVGCGGATVQHALVGAPVDPARARPNANPEVARESDEVRDGQGWIITPARTRIELRAATVIGDQLFTFHRFRARVIGDASPTFHADLEIDSLEGGSAGMASFVKERLLDVSAYPRATFDGTARRTVGTDACVVDGMLRLHGVERALRFDAEVHEQPGELHLVAVFDLPRKPFGVRLDGAWDTFVPDYVRVTLDVHAMRERVTVEEVK